jgi:hypothetical protein
VEGFRRTQRKWAFWGVVVGIGCIAACSIIFVGVFASLKSSEACALAARSLSASPEARQLLGEPVSTGIPTGSIEINGCDGSARFSFSATGPRGKDTVYVKARKELGEWRLVIRALKDDETGRVIDLVAESP